MMDEIEARAKAAGLKVTWADDDLPWDADDDCPAPAHVQIATVYAPGVDPSSVDARFPFYEGPTAPPGCVAMGPGHYRMREVLAAMGGIGFDSWSDPYVREVEIELLAEALDALDTERDRAACVEAAALQSRATYAMNAIG